MLLAPYPNNLNPVESFNFKTDFDLKGDGLVWYARPQPCFNCTLCPTGTKEPGYSASHKEVSLVYFSTFEPIDLTPDNIMQQVECSCSMTRPATTACPASTSALWRTCPFHSVFHRRQQSPYDSTSLQGRSSPWKRLC